MNKEQIIIVGAGIAGLSLAIQLAENKLSCLILEKRKNFDGPTSGVRISAEGVRVLEKIKIKNIGESSGRVVRYFGNIKADFKISNPDGFSPAIIVTRLAVYEKLMERVKALGIEIITGFGVSNVKEYPDGVEVVSDSGQHITGKLLVGADGVGSTVRKILNPGQSSGKTYAGYLGIGLITPSNAKMNMSLYQNHKSQVGIASIGKKSASDTNNNLFLWTHLFMPEEEAIALTEETAMEKLEGKSHYWRPEVRKIFEMGKTNPNSVISFGPVYNGKVPAAWFSKKIILIGDAAHPYGPGGNGISMALKDAESLCALLVSGDISEEKMAVFQRTRTVEAQGHGEGAEERNKPEKQITSRWSILFNGLILKLYHFFNRSVLKSFSDFLNPDSPID